MPTSLRVGPYRFFFYAGDHGEPSHTHVQRDQAEAKFWLSPACTFGLESGLFWAELRKLENLTDENEKRLMEIWHDYFDIGQ